MKTTAAVLGSYYRELIKEGLPREVVDQLIMSAASKLDHVVVADASTGENSE